jgi:hypothetical protein
VIVGNSKSGYWEYGLEFANDEWKTKPNADGAAIVPYGGDYTGLDTQVFAYKGQVGDGRKTLKTIKDLGKSHYLQRLEGLLNNTKLI